MLSRDTANSVYTFSPLDRQYLGLDDFIIIKTIQSRLVCILCYIEQSFYFKLYKNENISRVPKSIIDFITVFLTLMDEPSCIEYQSTILNVKEDMSTPRYREGEGFVIDVKESTARVIWKSLG